MFVYGLKGYCVKTYARGVLKFVQILGEDRDTFFFTDRNL